MRIECAVERTHASHFSEDINIFLYSFFFLIISFSHATYYTKTNNVSDINIKNLPRFIYGYIYTYIDI